MSGARCEGLPRWAGRLHMVRGAPSPIDTSARIVPAPHHHTAPRRVASRCTRVDIVAVFEAGAVLEKNKFGRIINISSGAGIAPNPHAPSYVPYGAAKAGLLGMTKLLARDAGEYGITVNAIAPGTALTPRVKRVRNEESIRNIAQMNPMKNLIEPIDCAKAALFLASEDARYVTGITMMVNAGNLIF